MTGAPMPENYHSHGKMGVVMPENTTGGAAQAPGLTPENAALLAEYATHLEHSPLSGHTPRTYLGAVRAYLAWLEQAEVDGDPLNDAAAKDWAVRDYRALPRHRRQAGHGDRQQAPGRARRTSTSGAASASRRASSATRCPGTRPKALEPRAKLRYLRAVEAWPVRPRPGHRAAAAVRRYPHRRDRRPGRRRRPPERPQGRAAPRRQGREVPHRARPPEAARGAGRLARRAPIVARRGLDGRPVHLRPGHQDDHRRASPTSSTAITRAAGLDDHVTSHVLRHTFGTELIRDGVDIVTVAELMGHASLETTRLYTRPSAADMQRAVDLLTADE